MSLSRPEEKKITPTYEQVEEIITSSDRYKHIMYAKYNPKNREEIIAVLGKLEKTVFEHEAFEMRQQNKLYRKDAITADLNKQLLEGVWLLKNYYQNPEITLSELHQVYSQKFFSVAYLEKALQNYSLGLNHFLRCRKAFLELPKLSETALNNELKGVIKEPQWKPISVNIPKIFKQQIISDFIRESNMVLAFRNPVEKFLLSSLKDVQNYKEIMDELAETEINSNPYFDLLQLKESAEEALKKSEKENGSDSARRSLADLAIEFYQSLNSLKKLLIFLQASFLAFPVQTREALLEVDVHKLLDQASKKQRITTFSSILDSSISEYNFDILFFTAEHLGLNKKDILSSLSSKDKADIFLENITILITVFNKCQSANSLPSYYFLAYLLYVLLNELTDLNSLPMDVTPTEASCFMAKALIDFYLPHLESFVSDAKLMKTHLIAPIQAVLPTPKSSSVKEINDLMIICDAKKDEIYQKLKKHDPKKFETLYESIKVRENLASSLGANYCFRTKITDSKELNKDAVTEEIQKLFGKEAFDKNYYFPKTKTESTSFFSRLLTKKTDKNDYKKEGTPKEKVSLLQVGQIDSSQSPRKRK